MGPRILWAAVTGFLIGVFTGSFLALSAPEIMFTVLIGISALALTIFDALKRALGAVFFVGLLCFVGGVVRMDAADVRTDPVLDEHLDEHVTLEGRVFDEPDVRESSVRLFVRVDALGTETEVDGGVLVIAPLHTDVHYGDRVRAKGTLRKPERFETGVGREFNYPAFLAKDGITYELAFVREIERVEGGWTNPIKAGSIWLKHVFLSGLTQALPEPHAGLAGGITVGDKRGLGGDLSTVFQTVGLIHIVVLSGYNIMIVMEALSRFLGWLRVSLYARFAASVVIAILFALMTGLASASVRAAAMAIIAVVGRLTGRLYVASRALGLVAAAMVLWNPYLLVFDPGFQLSILATAGLIAFTPFFVTRLPFVPKKFGMREIAATTLATQLAVLPLLLYQSGQMPIFSLPANILALVVVPLAMLFSAFAAVAGIVAPPVAPLLGFPAYALLTYIIGIAEVLASLPFSSVMIPAFSPWLLIPVYAVLWYVSVPSRVPETNA